MFDRDVDPRDLEPDDVGIEPTEEDAPEPTVPVSGDLPLEVGEGDWLESSIALGDDAEDGRDRTG